MELTELGYYPKKVAKSQPQKPARNRCHASTCSSVRPCCHLSDKNYRFSDNLPHSQALLEDQLSRITWRDIIFLFRGLDITPDYERDGSRIYCLDAPPNPRNDYPELIKPVEE